MACAYHFYDKSLLRTVSSDKALPVYVQVLPKICDGKGYTCSLPLLNSSYINFCDTIGTCSDGAIYDQDFSYEFTIPGDGYVAEFVNNQRRRLQEAQEQLQFYGQDESYWENGQFVSKYGERNSNHWITRYQLRIAFRPVDNFALYKALTQNQGDETWEDEMAYKQQQQQQAYEYKQKYWQNQKSGNYYKYYPQQSSNQGQEEEETDDEHEDDYIDWKYTNQNAEWRQEYYQTSKTHIYCFVHFAMVDHALNLDLYFDKTGYNKWVKWGRKWYEWGSTFLTYFKYGWTKQQKQIEYCENKYGWSEEDCIAWVQEGAGYVSKSQYAGYEAQAAASVGIIGLLACAYRRHKKRRIATEEEETDSNMIECTTTSTSPATQPEAASNFILL
jgi:hypothetical protein